MTKKIGITGTLAAIAVLAFACSSSTNDGAGGGTAGCVASISGSVSSACSACVQSKCATQVSGAETGCSDLLSCVCPNGTLDEALAAQCASKAQEASCTSATKTLSSCESASCSSECG